MVLLDFHMMFNEGVIDKGNGTMELARRFKTFEDENTRIGVKCCNHWGKKQYIRDLIQINRSLGPFTDKAKPDINYFTDGYYFTV